MFPTVFPHNLFGMSPRAIFLVTKAKSQEKKRAMETGHPWNLKWQVSKCPACDYVCVVCSGGYICSIVYVCVVCFVCVHAKHLKWEFLDDHL